MEEDEEEAACLHALRYLNSYMVSMVLKAAIELDVFGIIARAGPEAHLPAREIASQIAGEVVVVSKLDGMLRLLVTHTFLRCSLRASGEAVEERAYGIAPPAKFFMGSPDQGSFAPLLELCHHPSTLELSSSLKEAICGVGSQREKPNNMSSQREKPNNMPVFQVAGSDPKFGKMFNDSMVGYTAITMGKMLEVYKGFEGINSIVDVGGGTGKLATMIVSKYPSINCINFDLPHVIKAAPSYPGVKHVEGDMFDSVPTGDAILIKDVLHNWDDKHCLKLLKNCYEALPKKGKVIVITMTKKDLPDSNLSSRYIAEVDFLMQLRLTGNERNMKELEALCKASGFSSVQVVCSAYGISDVVEVVK